MVEHRLVIHLEFWNDALCENLTELDTPLIE